MSRPLIALLLLAPLAACGLRIPGITPYKIDIQQGNYISQEMVSQLKPGMSKDQVRLALGTPLLTDVFHADRWDYVYWREAPDGKRESRKLVVNFADGKLASLGGDVVPTRPEDGPPRERVVPNATTPVPAPKPAPAAPAAAATPPAAPATPPAAPAAQSATEPAQTPPERRAD
jgi:outer membrane protein assembly factor BamE